MVKEFTGWKLYPEWAKKALMGCLTLLTGGISLLVLYGSLAVQTNIAYALASLHGLTVLLIYSWRNKTLGKGKIGVLMGIIILTLSALYYPLIVFLIFPILLQSWIKSRSLVASWTRSALYHKEKPHSYLFFALLGKALPKVRIREIPPTEKQKEAGDNEVRIRKSHFLRNLAIINPVWWMLYIYAYIYATETGGYVIDEDGEIHALIEIRVNILGAEFREGTLTISEIGQRTTDTKNTLLGPVIVVNPGLRLNIAGKKKDSGDEDAIDYMFLNPGSSFFQEVNRFKREHP